MATAALKTALDIGLRVFPVSREKKKPRIRAWSALASADPDKIEAWTRQFPGCNWGALTGSESDAIVIDIDGPKGRGSIERLQSEFGALPPTLSVMTGRLDGGQQLYYRWPKGRELHSSQGAIAEGIDVKAWHSFAVIPDSLHKSGRRYEWENDLNRAVMPEWFVNLVEQNWIQRHERTDRWCRYHSRRARTQSCCGSTARAFCFRDIATRACSVSPESSGARARASTAYSPRWSTTTGHAARRRCRTARSFASPSP
jgi:hypothetical protein